RVSDEDHLLDVLLFNTSEEEEFVSEAESSSETMEANISEPTDKETIINLVMKQCKLLFLRTRNPNKKIRKTLIKKVVPSMDSVSKEFKFDPTYENIEQFIVGKVWRQKLSKFLEASDFSELKRSQSSLKSLENFIAESLKIHVDYQIAINNQEKPSYSEDVLEKIKRLDQLTLHLTIPSASRRNCVNELDLNQMSIEYSDNE
ncbi:4279_t:CDS:2, partial [Gigaspora rosea]